MDLKQKYRRALHRAPPPVADYLPCTRVYLCTPGVKPLRAAGPGSLERTSDRALPREGELLPLLAWPQVRTASMEEVAAVDEIAKDAGLMGEKLRESDDK